jgi:hypothetical protein
MLHGHDVVAKVRLPPTKEGCGLVGGRPPPFWWCSSCGGSMSKLGHVGVGGRVPSGGARCCVTGTVRPFV